MEEDLKKETRENKVSFKILDDDVTENDAFGAHQKVANAISCLIKSNDYGKSIGLIGNWGSGKSSIIRMIEKNLKNICEVFIFDAWAHEGDPMKRSFLETLIEKLCSINWLKKEDWKERTEELARKREKNKITTYKYPTIIGVCFAISSIIFLISKEVLSHWPNIEWIVLIIFSILIFSPLFVASCAIYKYLKTKDLKYFSFMTNKGSETTESTSYKTIDPTSIEFKNIFKEIFDKIENDGEKKFLIVVDNLDRIDEEDALKIWATMKTFFETDGICDKWKKKLWLLVPFDKNALENLWKDKKGADTQAGQDKQDEQKGKLASCFIEKTFQINFETPYLLLNDWENYFKSKFIKAFTNYKNESEIHKIFRIYDLEGRTDNKPPTPREIKIFINNLGASFLINNENIPLHIQALYIIKRKDEWKDDNVFLKNIKKPKGENIFKNPEERLFLEKDYRIKLASLYFKVEEKRARALLLEADIIKAIIEEDETIYKSLFEVPGVDLETEKIIEGNFKIDTFFSDINLDKLLIIYRNLSIVDSNKSCIKRSIQIIKDRIEKNDNWDSFNDKMADGLVRLLKNHQNDLKYDKIFSALGKLKYLVEGTDEEGKSFHGLQKVEILNESISGINSVLRSIKKIDEDNKDAKLENILERNFKVEIGNQHMYNHFIAFLTNNYSNEEVIKYYKSIYPVNVISDSLNGIIRDGSNIPPNLFKVVEYYYKANLNINWAVLTRSLIARQKTLSIDDIEYDAISLILLSMAKLNIISNEDIVAYVKSPEIFECFSLYVERTEYEILFPIFSLLAIFNNDNTITKPSDIANKGKNYFEKIIKDCEEEFITKYADYIIKNNLAQFVVILEHEFLNEFIKTLDNIIFKRTDATKLFENEFIYNNESILYNNLENELYKEFFENTEKENKISKFTLDKTFDVEKASMYDILLREIDNTENDFALYLKNGLKNIDTEIWKKELVAEYVNIYDLLISMKERNVTINLTSPFEKAISELLTEANSDEKIKEKLKKYWTTIISSFEEGTLKIFKQNMRDHFFINTENSIEQILEIVGVDFIDFEILKEKIKDVLRKLVNNILNRNSLLELSWLNHLFKKVNEIEKNAHDEYGYIKDIIAKKNINTLEDKLKIEYKNLDSLLGIKREEKEITNDETDRTDG